jgi:hypothetical protein
MAKVVRLALDDWMDTVGDTRMEAITGVTMDRIGKIAPCEETISVPAHLISKPKSNIIEFPTENKVFVMAANREDN